MHVCLDFLAFVYLLFRHLQFYAGPGMEENNFAVYIQKVTDVDGRSREQLKMLNLQTNLTRTSITFQGEVKYYNNF